MIENVLQNAFQLGELQAQEPKLNFDFIKIITARKAIINVNEYKLMLDKMRKNGIKSNERKRNNSEEVSLVSIRLYIVVVPIDK